MEDLSWLDAVQWGLAYVLAFGLWAVYFSVSLVWYCLIKPSAEFALEHKIDDYWGRLSTPANCNIDVGSNLFFMFILGLASLVVTAGFIGVTVRTGFFGFTSPPFLLLAGTVSVFFAFLYSLRYSVRFFRYLKKIASYAHKHQNADGVIPAEIDAPEFK